MYSLEEAVLDDSIKEIIDEANTIERIEAIKEELDKQEVIQDAVVSNMSPTMESLLILNQRITSAALGVTLPAISNEVQVNVNIQGVSQLVDLAKTLGKILYKFGQWLVEKMSVFLDAVIGWFGHLNGKRRSLIRGFNELGYMKQQDIESLCKNYFSELDFSLEGFDQRLITDERYEPINLRSMYDSLYKLAYSFNYFDSMLSGQMRSVAEADGDVHLDKFRKLQKDTIEKASREINFTIHINTFKIGEDGKVIRETNPREAKKGTIRHYLMAANIKELRDQEILLDNCTKTITAMKKEYVGKYGYTFMRMAKNNKSVDKEGIAFINGCRELLKNHSIVLVDIIKAVKKVDKSYLICIEDILKYARMNRNA